MLNIYLLEKTKIKYISNTKSILHYTIHIASIARSIINCSREKVRNPKNLNP